MTETVLHQETIDLRGTPLEARSEHLFAIFGGLQNGSPITLLTEYDPRAFSARLNEVMPGQIACRCYRTGDGEWRVVVERTARVDESPRGWIRRTAAFADLSAAAVEELAACARERFARKGDEIVAAGSVSFLGIVCEGTLALLRGNDRRERALYEIFPSEMFCDAAFFDSGRTLGRYAVLSKTLRYLALPYDDLRRIGAARPEVLAAVGLSCAQHVRALADGLCAQASQSIIGRIAGALVPYAPYEPGLQPALAPLPGMTQARIAASAGTVKEVAARAIAELEALGALRREHGHITYLDRSILLATATQK